MSGDVWTMICFSEEIYCECWPPDSTKASSQPSCSKSIVLQTVTSLHQLKCWTIWRDKIHEISPIPLFTIKRWTCWCPSLLSHIFLTISISYFLPTESPVVFGLVKGIFVQPKSSLHWNQLKFRNSSHLDKKEKFIKKNSVLMPPTFQPLLSVSTWAISLGRKGTTSFFCHGSTWLRTTL